MFLHTPQTINTIQLLQTFSLLSPKWVYQVVLVVRKLSANAGDLRDTSSIPGSGRSPGGGHGNPLQYSWASLVTQLVKNLPAIQETWVQTLHEEDSLKKKKKKGRSLGEANGYQLQYSCLENPHGQRSLVGYSPKGCKESDMMKQLIT